MHTQAAVYTTWGQPAAAEAVGIRLGDGRTPVYACNGGAGRLAAGVPVLVSLLRDMRLSLLERPASRCCGCRSGGGRAAGAGSAVRPRLLFMVNSRSAQVQSVHRS